MATEIRPGCRVTLHLRLGIEGGPVVEDTFGGAPLRFALGDGTLAPPLEGHLLGLSLGERRTFVLEPEEGFGAPDPEAVHVLPREAFPGDVAPGMLWRFSLPGGEVPGRIVEVGEQVTVDFNHPLAGHRLRMEVEVLGIEPP